MDMLRTINMQVDYTQVSVVRVRLWETRKRATRVHFSPEYL